MRLLAALALVGATFIACGGGGSSSPPVQIAPAVTTAPTADPAAPKTPLPTYYEGY